MFVDIYTEKPEDPRYDPNKILEDDELALLIAQIKMILLTKKRSILGSPDFGIDAESYLFEFSGSVSLNTIEAEAQRAISRSCSLLGNRSYSVKAILRSLEGDSNRQAIHLLITIDSTIRFVMAYY